VIAQNSPEVVLEAAEEGMMNGVKDTTPARTLVLVLVSACVGAALAFGYMKVASFEFWSRTPGDVRSASSNEILLMRTKGGLLEVSTIRATELLDARFVYSVLGIPIGETAPRIRVPAYYRYQVALAPEWRVLRTGETFTVVSPSVKPSLPVAVDLAQMEKDVAGTWVLLPFTRADDLNDLERRVTAKLAQKAVSPVYVQLQREQARATVAEFVRKWLLTQAQWQSATQPRLRVLFADEPVGSIDSPLLRP
jgi:hypothetical protein